MPLSKHIIRVPVKLADGHWELLYGGPVKVKDGALGELHIDRIHFYDEQFLATLTEKRRIPVISVGTELRVALTIRNGLEQGLRKFLLDSRETRYVRTARMSPDTRFVPVTLVGPTEAQQARDIKVGGLWLCLEGIEARGIESGMVKLPETHNLETADSLNHALTQLSEVFEPWRKAHTGNVYERVFYQERNDHWYPLNDLRDRALVDAERKVITDLWANVAAALGISWL